MATYYNDNDPAAAAWLRALIAAGQIPEGEVDERSILDVEPADLARFRQCHFFAGIGGWAYALRLAGWPDDRPVWTGSPPCQPFSVAGQSRGRDDARHLAPHFLELVAACRPPILFGEQVASALVIGRVGNKEMHPLWRRQSTLTVLKDRIERQLSECVPGMPQRRGSGSPHDQAFVHSDQSEPSGVRREVEGAGKGNPVRSDEGIYSGKTGRGGVRGDRHPVLDGYKERLGHALAGQESSEQGLHHGEHQGSAVCCQHGVRRLGRGPGEDDRARNLGYAHEQIERSIEENIRDIEASPEWTWLDTLQLQLERNSFAFGTSALPACSVGAPHPRQRCFFGAYDLRFGAGGLADAGCASDEPWRHDLAGAPGEDQGRGEERQRVRDDAGHGIDADRMADADGREPGKAGGLQPGGEYRREPEEGGAGELGDPVEPRLEGQPGRGDNGHEPGRLDALPDRPVAATGAVDRPGPVGGVWRDADWLGCTDGRWRPVEPGTQPLAYGVPGRVGLLRGYGNGIVPQVAAEFVMAFEEARSVDKPDH